MSSLATTESTRLQARKLGVSLAVDTGETPFAQVQKQLGMQEGFDVGLEMSGKESALREMIANMARFWLSTSSGRLFRPVVILESEA